MAREEEKHREPTPDGCVGLDISFVCRQAERNEERHLPQPTVSDILYVQKIVY